MVGGLEAHPVDESGLPPIGRKGSREILRPSWRAGRGREALLEEWEGLVGPGEVGNPSKGPGEVGRPSRKNGRGQDVLREGRKVWEFLWGCSRG